MLQPDRTGIESLREPSCTGKGYWRMAPYGRSNVLEGHQWIAQHGRSNVLLDQHRLHIAQHRLHGHGVGPTLVLLIGERPVDQIDERFRKGRRHACERWCGLRNGGKQLFVVGLGLVDLPARKSKEHRGADSPQIGAAIEQLRSPAGLLRWHECWCPHRRAGRRRVRALRTTESCDPKIEQFDLAAGGQENVAWFDISVDDSVGMCSNKHVEQVVYQGKKLESFEPFFPIQPDIECLAL